MSVGRVFVLLVAGWLYSGLSGAASVSVLPDSSFGDWKGTVREIDMLDGSVLFEYTAGTFSGRVEGARLAIVFVPRFNCRQTVNVRLPVDGDVSAADIRLEFSFGEQQKTYPVIADIDNENDAFSLFSLATTVAELDKLRAIVDVSPRTTIRVVSGTEDGESPGIADGSDTVEFSLLGSRLATLSAQRSCRSHVPLEFKRH